MNKAKITLLPVLLAFLAASLVAARPTVLHSFGKTSTDGRWPEGSVLIVGSTLYGMTSEGGTRDWGTIFKVNKDGTGYQVLHNFTDSPSDGGSPWGSLVKWGDYLYGFTNYGGTSAGSSGFFSGDGTVFRIKTDGSEFKVLHSFSYNDPTSGAWPNGTPLIVGSGSTQPVFYGMTFCGGQNDDGSLFKLNLDGTGFQVIHFFSDNTWDGCNPRRGALLAIGSMLYGMTSSGGANDEGTIFRVRTDGSGFTLLHSCSGAGGDVWSPDGSLIQGPGSTLYGMAHSGGTNMAGAIFKVNINGQGFALLHSFIKSEASCPTDTLLLSSGTLYGMTLWGGVDDKGAIFKVNTDGTGFSRIHSFSGWPEDGQGPWGSLTWDGEAFYGMTCQGGSSKTAGTFGWGTVFEVPTADIAVTISSDNLAPVQGMEFNFTITASNNGPRPATELRVKDQLPAGLTYVASSPSQGTYNPDKGAWIIGTLARGTSASLTLGVKAAKAGTFTNTALRTALNEQDLVPSNNSASVTVKVTSKYPPYRGRSG